MLLCCTDPFTDLMPHDAGTSRATVCSCVPAPVLTACPDAPWPTDFVRTVLGEDPVEVYAMGSSFHDELKVQAAWRCARWQANSDAGAP